MLAHAADAPKIDPAKLSAHIKVLSSDEFEGSGPATAGETKSVDYIVGQMKAIGLEPAGDLKDGYSGKEGRAWTQDVPLGKFDIKGPVTAQFTIGGKAVPLAQGEQIAIRAAMTNVDNVAIKDAPIVFVGYGVKAPERNWDDFKGLDLKGKILVVLINDPDFETGSGDFGGKAMTYYGRWTYKFEEAARQGAAGVLIVHETAPASYGWATVKNSNTNTMFDIVRKEPAKSHPALESWIQRDVAVDLFKSAGLDFDALKKQAQSRDFKPVELKGATFSAAYAVDHSVIVSKNIAGRIKGSARPDETVIYSAHWDHLGVGQPDAKGDKIYNGAIDNADGIAAILELARAFKSQPAPQRSILFLAVTAEERGLLGSEYYAANPLYPAVQDRRRPEHRRPVGGRSGQGHHHLGRRQGRPAGPAGRQGQGPRPLLHARPLAPGRPLLPLGPLPVRQARRAGHLGRLGRGPGQGRQGSRPEGGRGLHRQPLPPAGRRMVGGLGPERPGPGHRPVLRDRRGPGQFEDLAEWQAGSEFKALRDTTKADRK
jgi:hypothetical protein